MQQDKVIDMKDMVENEVNPVECHLVIISCSCHRPILFCSVLQSDMMHLIR